MRLIDADSLKENLGYYPMLTDLMIRMFTRIINEAEDVDTSLRVGQWIPSDDGTYECSHCWGISKKPTLYCPTCGQRNLFERKKK